MRTIEIDEDTYQFIAKSTQEIGESASAILRRLLGLNIPDEIFPIAASKSHELSGVLGQKALSRYRSEPLDRLLVILSGVFKDREGQFESIGEIGGSKRTYLSKSKDKILQSGTSTNPRQVPDTPFWIYTNSNTNEKKKFLQKILHGCDYSSDATADALETLITGR